MSVSTDVPNDTPCERCRDFKGDHYVTFGGVAGCTDSTVQYGGDEMYLGQEVCDCTGFVAPGEKR